MKFLTSVLVVAVLAVVFAAAPAVAGKVYFESCAEVRIEPLSDGEHPKRLQTAYFVTDPVQADGFRLSYTVERGWWGFSDTEFRAHGSLIGRFEVYRDGEIAYRSPKKRHKIYPDTWPPPSPMPMMYNIRQAWIGWPISLNLKPGDIVLFTARFQDVPDLERGDGWTDRVTVTGVIRDSRRAMKN